MESLTMFFGIIVSPDFYKAYAVESLSEVHELFTATLYKYSHKKHHKLFQQPLFLSLFELYYYGGGFDLYLKQDKTLSQNPDAYRAVARDNLVAAKSIH